MTLCVWRKCGPYSGLVPLQPTILVALILVVSSSCQNKPFPKLCRSICVSDCKTFHWLQLWNQTDVALWYKFFHEFIARIENKTCLPPRYIFSAKMTFHISGKEKQPIFFYGEQKILMLSLRMTEMHKIVFCVVWKKSFLNPPPPLLEMVAGDIFTDKSYLYMLACSLH